MDSKIVTGKDRTETWVVGLDPESLTRVRPECSLPRESVGAEVDEKVWGLSCAG